MFALIFDMLSANRPDIGQKKVHDKNPPHCWLLSEELFNGNKREIIFNNTKQISLRG